MRKFEYKILSFKMQQTSPTLEDTLDGLGGLGWELVGTIASDVHQPVVFIFKRASMAKMPRKKVIRRRK